MKPRQQRDEGAVLVLVAIMIVVLLGVAALVIDIGRLHVEKRELQNGADAAALAVAQDCAKGDCKDAMVTAGEYARANANDGLAEAYVCGKDEDLTPCAGDSPPRSENATGWVRVETQTETADGDEINFVLAPIMGAITGKTVDAQAVVAWGPPYRLETIPFLMPLCEYQRLGGVPDQPPPTGVSYIYAKQKPGRRDEITDCDRSPGGGLGPGNFAWLDKDADDGCSAIVSLGPTGGEPGSNFELAQDGCDPDDFKGAVVPVPLYDGPPERNGQNLTYNVIGFVGYQITGWWFGEGQGQDFEWHLAGTDPVECPIPAGYKEKDKPRCFRGEFTEWIGPNGDFGTGPNYGASVIKMIG